MIGPQPNRQPDNSGGPVWNGRQAWPIPGFPRNAQGRPELCPKCATAWALIALAFIAAVMLYRRRRRFGL